jgi:hypothetical protein
MGEGYVIVVCGALIALIYKFVILYLDVTTAQRFKSWDAKTCTPADYTIEIKITQQMLQAY